jgi:hypothetical protein
MFLNPVVESPNGRIGRKAVSFSALLADTRTQLGMCWEAATEIARNDAPLADHPGRMQLMAALSRLLDSLGYFDTGVGPSSTSPKSMNQAVSVRQHYVDVRSHGQAALLAGGRLIEAAANSSHPAGEERAAVLGDALARLRAHIEELEDVLGGERAQVA